VIRVVLVEEPTGWRAFLCNDPSVGPGETAVGVGGREVGVETDRRVEVGQGAVVLLLGEPGVAAVGVDDGELGVETDRLAIVGDGDGDGDGAVILGGSVAPEQKVRLNPLPRCRAAQRDWRWFGP
jgi:hypothetical protein